MACLSGDISPKRYFRIHPRLRAVTPLRRARLAEASAKRAGTGKPGVFCPVECEAFPGLKYPKSQRDFRVRRRINLLIMLMTGNKINQFCSSSLCLYNKTINSANKKIISNKRNNSYNQPKYSSQKRLPNPSG